MHSLREVGRLAKRRAWAWGCAWMLAKMIHGKELLMGDRSGGVMAGFGVTAKGVVRREVGTVNVAANARVIRVSL